MVKELKVLREFNKQLQVESEEEKNIQDILYYGKLTVSKNDNNKKNENKLELFMVEEIVDNKVVRTLQTKDGIVATINEENEIKISNQYKHLINEMEILLQLRDVVPLSMNKLEELENKRNEKSKQEENEEKEEKKKEQHKYIAKIDVNKKITANKTIKELVPEIKQKGIDEVIVRRTKTNEFEFVGINRDGEEIELQSISQTEGIMPSKEVVQISRDGSKVEKEKVMYMMRIQNGTNEGHGNEGFTINIGDYGTPEINYYRRSPETNEYTSIPVNLENTNQKRTDKDVQEYMDKRKNTKVNDNIKRVEDLENNQKDIELEDMDDNMQNDRLEHNVLIEKAAARCKVSYDAFMIEYNKTNGDTIEERIEEAEEELNAQYMGRDERSKN